MSKTRFTEMSDEELIKKQKTLSSLTYILAGAIMVLIVAATFLTVMNGFTILVFLPVGLLPLLIFNYNNLNKMQREMAARKLTKPRPGG